MKFVCDQCNTKYSIADEKVRRKVLKIRCKNCSHIIVVSEQAEGTDAVGEKRRPNSAEVSADVERVSPGSSHTASGIRRPHYVSQGALAALRPSSSQVPELEELAAESTRLSNFPDFPPGAEANPTPGAALLEDEWYLATEGNQFGPMSFLELCSRVRRGEASGGDAYVWRDGFDDWLEPHSVPELKPFLPKHPPPPPRGKSGLFPSLGVQIPSALPPAVPPPYPPGVPSHATITHQAQPAVAVAAPVPPIPPRAAPPVFVPSKQPVPQSNSGLELLVDSGVPPQPLPALGANLAPLPPVQPGGAAEPGYAVLPLPLAKPTTGTPLLLKITAVAGVASLLCGVGLIGYFVFYDRLKQPARVALPIPSEPVPAPAVPVAQPPPPSRQESPQEFQPMEISHSEHAGKERTGRVANGHKHGKAPPSTERPAAGPGNDLSEKQRRLAALYGTSGGAPELPTPAVPTKKVAGPRRDISSNELLTLQQKHRPALNACYDRALKRDESLADMKAEVTITIDDRGLVKNVAIQGVHDEELVACLRKNIRYWAFAPVGEQTFRFPVIFRGS